MQRFVGLGVAVSLSLAFACSAGQNDIGGKDSDAGASADADGPGPDPSSSDGGGIDGGDADATPPGPVARYGYHLHEARILISALDPGTGAERALGAVPLPTVNNFLRPALSPSQKSLLVGNSGEHMVYSFSVAPGSGWLTPGVTTDVVDTPADLQFHPNGSVVYMALAGPAAAGLQIFDFDATTGGLVKRGGLIGSRVGRIALTPAGKFLYACTREQSNIAVYGYSIEPSNGALTPLAGGQPVFSRAASANACIIDPAGHTLTVPLETAGVVRLAINETSGVLTEIAGSPLAAGSAARDVVFTPDGRFLYAVTSSGIAGHAIDATTGVATPTTLSAAPTANTLAVDPTGRFLYEARSLETKIWAIGNDGSLTDAGRSPLGALTITISSGDPVGLESRNVYVLDSAGNGGVLSYALDGAGTLQPIGTKTSVDFGYDLAVSSSGRWVYALSPLDGIHVYTPTAAGALQELPSSPVTTIGSSYHLAVDPSERYAFVSHLDANVVRVYKLGVSGLPVYSHEISPGLKPAGIAFDPSGGLVWIAASGADTIYAGYLSQGNGLVLGGQSVATEAGGKPSAVVFAPDGRHAFVSLPGLSKVVSYFFAAAGDYVPSAKTSIAVGATPAGLSVDPSSRTLYVAGVGGSAIYSFTIDPTSSILTPTASPSIASGPGPFALAIDSEGQHLFATSGGGAVFGGLDVYTRSGTGELTKSSNAPAISGALLGVAVRDVRR